MEYIKKRQLLEEIQRQKAWIIAMKDQASNPPDKLDVSYPRLKAVGFLRSSRRLA